MTEQALKDRAQRAFWLYVYAESDEVLAEAQRVYQETMWLLVVIERNRELGRTVQ